MIDLINTVFSIVKDILIPLAFALCLFYFFWGVVKYIGTGAEKGIEEGKNIMIYGIVGLFVAFSIWGIISFIQSQLGLPDIQNVNKK